MSSTSKKKMLNDPRSNSKEELSAEVDVLLKKLVQGTLTKRDFFRLSFLFSSAWIANSIVIPESAQAAYYGTLGFWKGKIAPQKAYTTPGTFSWTCPAGVTSVSVVCVGGGGGGPYGGGAGLGYKNNYSVTPGNSYTVVVGAGGAANTDGQDSYFDSIAVVKGGKGISGGGGPGAYTGDGGGTGGSGSGVGGGGAGGYSGAGGTSGNPTGTDGAGGGGGGGGYGSGPIWPMGAGGGVGILGQGASGTGGTSGNGGNGGSGGASGSSGNSSGSGGTYGGGGGGRTDIPTYHPGGSGAVRIIWPGNLRQFPSTRTADE